MTAGSTAAHAAAATFLHAFTIWHVGALHARRHNRTVV
jgi:hypothetical protein